MKSKEMAYLMWILWFFGFAGIHRFYLGKPISGLIWFFTWGLFGVGQIVDLLLIPDMVDRKNLSYRDKLRQDQYTHIPPSKIPPRSDTQLILKLLSEKSEATLADCVLALGKDTRKVKALLEQMQRDELIEVSNRERDGAIIYRMI